jgi:hypothetical protein
MLSGDPPLTWGSSMLLIKRCSHPFRGQKKTSSFLQKIPNLKQYQISKGAWDLRFFRLMNAEMKIVRVSQIATIDVYILL